jgi:hypothetical protein
MSPHQPTDKPDQPELGTSQRRHSGDAGTALPYQPGPKRLSLAGQVPQAGPPPEQPIHLPRERPGTC